MPLSALDHDAAEHVCRLSEMAPLLTRLVTEPLAPGVIAMPTEPDEVQDSVRNDLMGLPDEVVENAPPSGFTCPECHGALWEAKEGELSMYRCRVGHSFTMESLLSTRSTVVEAALWTALTALEERIDLANRLTRRMHDRGNPMMVARYEANAREARASAAVLRELLLAGGRGAPEDEAISAD
jgi:two-component system chemotaxis response regulator CheB